MYKSILKFIFAYRREVIVTTVSLLIFIIALLFSSQLINFWSAISIEKEETKVEAAIQQELQNISVQREQIIASGTLAGALKRNSPLELLAIAQAEAKKRNLDFVVITDKDGFVLARSHLPMQTGDNLFETTAHGRIIDMGETITVAVRGARSPLIFVSASPISDGGLPIGGITVGYTLDNSYATRFKNNIYSKGVKLLSIRPKKA